jgi:hypothetical protein
MDRRGFFRQLLGLAVSVGAIDFWDPQTAVDNDGAPMLNGSGPLYSSNPWDIVFIGGDGIPGICKVHGLPTLAFDKKKSGGVDGAVMTVNGYIPGPIEVEVVLWTQEQWDTFQVLAPKIWRKPAKKTKAKDVALTIAHPAFDLWGINAVIIVGVSVPENGPIPQSKLIKIKMVEYVPQAKGATHTAKAPVPVAEDSRTSGAANGLGDPPSKTDLGPKGPGVSKLPGG